GGGRERRTPRSRAPATLFLTFALLAPGVAVAQPGPLPLNLSQAEPTTPGAPAAPTPGAAPTLGAPAAPTGPAQLPMPQQLGPIPLPASPDLPGLRPYVPAVPPPPSQFTLPGDVSLYLPLPSAARFELHPTFSILGQYTDNFRPEREGNQITNYRVAVTPGLALLLNDPKTSGSAVVFFGASWDSSDDRISPFGGGSIGFRHIVDPRLNFTLTDSFSVNNDPDEANAFGLAFERETFFSNTLIVAANWLIDIFQTQFYYRNSVFVQDGTTMTNALGGNVSVPVGPLMTLSGGAEVSVTTNSIDTGLDDTSFGIREFASLSRRFGEFLTGGVSVSHSYGQQSNSNIFNASVFGAYSLPTGLSVSSRMGVSYLIADSTSGRATFSTNTSASYRFARSVVGAGYFQDFVETGLEGQDFGIVITHHLTGFFTYAFTPFLFGRLSGGYDFNEFTDVGTASGQPRIKSRTRGTASLNWQVTRWLGAALRYDYIWRDFVSSPPRDSGENRVTLSLGATF
ncbi:MAG: hypothetical protein L0027_11530, partial [Candidatus Rokubacteria bacterium]|nr:hypothetical protein [Candidatus Rokubacteria bacterium]